MTTSGLAAPTPLTTSHLTATFTCGEPSLDDWLKRRAWRNETSGASRTYIVAIENEVAGYYCLASGGVGRAEAPKSMQRNMPDQIPVVVMGRLAVDIRFQGMGLGSALLRDASTRTLLVSQTVGVRAMLLHAISDEAKAFYLAHSFLESSVTRMMLCLPIETIRRAAYE